MKSEKCKVMVNFRLGGNFHFIVFVCANIGALGATPHPSAPRADTCLAAARSRRGSDSPPDCHSIPRRRSATQDPGEGWLVGTLFFANQRTPFRIKTFVGQIGIFYLNDIVIAILFEIKNSSLKYVKIKYLKQNPLIFQRLSAYPFTFPGGEDQLWKVNR